MTQDPIARWEWEGGTTAADPRIPARSTSGEAPGRSGPRMPGDAADARSDRDRRSDPGALDPAPGRRRGRPHG